MTADRRNKNIGGQRSAVGGRSNYQFHEEEERYAKAARFK
jgi:hypothetical protein